MKTTYDPDADAVYVKLKEGEVEKTIPVDENVMLDLNKTGDILGIEILFVKGRNPGMLKLLHAVSTASV